MPKSTNELREARVRSKLKGMGYSLQKTRYRRPDLRSACPGFRILNARTNALVAGDWFSLTLDQVEEFQLENKAPRSTAS